MSLFQIITIGVFIFFIVFAVLVFSGIIPLFGTSPDGVGGTVTMWGTLPASSLDGSIAELNIQNEGVFTLNYVEKSEDTFDAEIVEAIASNRAPDLILLPQDLIVRQENKVIPISYDSLSVRDFKNTFIEEGELYLSAQGILALPFSVDPLVLYWNRDIFNEKVVSQPPELWDQLLVLAPAFTVKDEGLNVRQSAVALGEFGNVSHSKDILSLLILQAGNPMVERSESGLTAVLDERRGLVTKPAESAVRFYTGFSNPSKPIYTWNRSLPESKDLFASGNLAVYIGYASERSEIIAQSPNLNFDVALVPQARDSKTKTTLGKMTGIATLRSSRNPQTALYVAGILSGNSFLDLFSQESGLPPARRDLLLRRTTGSVGQTLYGSALIARGWLDPSPSQTQLIFKTLIENVTSGRTSEEGAVSRANGELNRLLAR